MSAPQRVPSPETWARDLGRSLRPFRPATARWRLALIDGPNMSNLGEGGRDRRTYGSINSIGELQGTIAALADGLGVALSAYQSNREGDIVAYIYDRIEEVDAFLINPAALTRYGAPCALALADSRKQYVELHFANIATVAKRHIHMRPAKVSRRIRATNGRTSIQLSCAIADAISMNTSGAMMRMITASTRQSVTAISGAASDSPSAAGANISAKVAVPKMTSCAISSGQVRIAGVSIKIRHRRP